MAHRVLVVSVILLGIFCSRESYGQISSAAFDPNCYQPHLGIPSEIDSVYGSQDQQHLGEYMYGFPPTTDFPAGKIGIGNLPNNPLFLSFVQEGPTFDLQQLQAKAKKSNLPVNFASYGYLFGHFHDRQHIDLFVRGREIFWADDYGDYDSSRYTLLRSSLVGTFGYDFSPSSYAAFLTSDSVFDIVILVNVDDTPAVPYAVLFHGGEHLFDQGKTAYQDSTYQFKDHSDHVLNLNNSMRFLQGDFRGTGREDLITSDDSGNWFFYRNDPPFSLAKFADALYNDTMFTVWENAYTIKAPAANILGAAQVFRILPHQTGDLSQDLMIGIQDHNSLSLKDFIRVIFRGNPSFGSTRLKISDGELILHNPYYYDNSFFEMTLGPFTDCGDMSGKGNNVFFSPDGAPGFFTQFFYVAGNALDDKVDMYYGYQTQGGGGGIVPFDAEGDKYHDVLLGDNRYTTQNDVDNSKTYVGTIHLVHGSNKIPVRLNPKYAVVSPNKSQNSLSVFPNPANDITTISFESSMGEDIHFILRDLLGRSVKEWDYQSLDAQNSIKLYVQDIPAGTYILDYESHSERILQKISIIH